MARTAHTAQGLNPEPVLVSWSGGKDSSLALHTVLADPTLEVKGLLTTITEGYDRISMHGVRRGLLHAQAASIGVPLIETFIPPACSNELYEQVTSTSLRAQQELGINSVVFGDLFLQDVRAYRERLLGSIGMNPMFPLWDRSTHELAREFIRLGFRAVLCTVDPGQLDPGFTGREYDAQLLDDLPESIDPCAENGEFHTFAYDGPIFRQPIALVKGEVVERDGFWFCDLIEGDS